MDLVGEIVITESMVPQSRRLRNRKRTVMNRQPRELRKLTNELQEIVMSVRMVPVGGNISEDEPNCQGYEQTA